MKNIEKQNIIKGFSTVVKYENKLHIIALIGIIIDFMSNAHVK